VATARTSAVAVARPPLGHAVIGRAYASGPLARLPVDGSARKALQGVRNDGVGLRYPWASMPPLFADDNSSSRRAARREAELAKARERRRDKILETLRRLKDEAGDPAALAAEERARRHQEMLDRYPPLF
jgi:hypothetical protein